MAAPASTLPNAWSLYNLIGSPFFQDTLEANRQSTRPLGALFVGRSAELAELRGRVHAAGPHGSRQAVGGSPGVGKTTLVQELKSALFADGYMTTDSFVPFLPGDTSESVFGRVLGALYETIVANRPMAVNSPAMRDAQLLVRSARLTSLGGGFSIAGFGVNTQSGATPVTPQDLLIDGPRVMRDLLRLVGDSGAHGVVVHLNNLETLSEADVARAAETLRALRDLLVMHDGLHIVLVGTTEAVQTAVNTHSQVRNVFSILECGPLGAADVHAMLHSRYRHMRADRKRPVVEPVDPAAVEAIFELFRGDLRGMLKALDDGATLLLGVAGTETDSDAPARPLRLDEIRPGLQKRYAARLAALPETARVDQLSAWGQTAPDAAQTQASLRMLWKLSQPGVSTALKYMIQHGYVLAMPRQGREPIRYVLSGGARLIFDPLP